MNRIVPLALLVFVAAVAPAGAAEPVDIFGPLTAAVGRCWAPPPGAAGAVSVRFELDRDGRLVGSPTVSGLASPGVAAAAVHAVKFCAPYRLPLSRFTDWQHPTVRLSTQGGG